MAELFFLLLVAGGVLTVISVSMSADLKRKARAAELAGVLDLQVSTPNAFSPLAISGMIDGFSVNIENHPTRATTAVLLATIRDSAIPNHLTVERRLIGAAGEHVTGDPSFDRAFRVDGDPTRISSLLTKKVRAALLELPQAASVTIDCASLSAMLSLSGDADGAINTMRQLVAVAREFRDESGSIHERLHRESRDLSLGVATTAFYRLMAANPPDAIARDAVDEALATQHVELLISAMAHARAQHAERLRELFAASADNDGLRAAALDALRRIYEPAPVNLSELARSAGPKTRVAIAAFFRADDRVSDEEILIGMLSDPDADVQDAAARALERVGTVHAVDALREWSRGVFRSVQVKELADGAVRAIQSRVAAVAGPGQLSIAPGEETPGSVSLSPSTGGALSDPES